MASENTEVSEEFAKVIGDFVSDIVRTFPEYNPFIRKWWKTADDFTGSSGDSEEDKKIYNARKKKDILFLYKYCSKKYPPRFFQILNQDESIFSEESEVDTEFLPFIHFKNLWQDDISDDTRSTIWKYLQIVLFSVVNSVKDKEAFGDTAKMFEDMDEGEFKQKLDDALDEIKGIFENRTTGDNDTDSSNSSSFPTANSDDIHNHLSGMFSGKLGNLAREIAEETAGEINMDMDGATDVKDVFSKMFKNPGKLMGLVQNVGNKLEQRMKSGEINQTELMQEASEMMNKMKDIPGMGDMQSMLNKLGVNTKGAKMDFKGMQNRMNQEMKLAKAREHAQKAAEKKRAAQSAPAQHIVHSEPKYTDEELVNIMKDASTDESGVQKKKKKHKSKKT